MKMLLEKSKGPWKKGKQKPTGSKEGLFKKLTQTADEYSDQSDRKWKIGMEDMVSKYNKNFNTNFDESEIVEEFRRKI